MNSSTCCVMEERLWVQSFPLICSGTFISASAPPGRPGRRRNGGGDERGTENHLKEWLHRGIPESGVVPLPERARGGGIDLPRHSGGRARKPARPPAARTHTHRPVPRCLLGPLWRG